MSNTDLKAELARLRAENAALKENRGAVGENNRRLASREASDDKLSETERALLSLYIERMNILSQNMGKRYYRRR